MGKYFQRYSPSGQAPASVVRFDGGPALTIVWSRLGAPSTMWADDEQVQQIVDGLQSAATVSFQEGDRKPVVFVVGDASNVIAAVRGSCRSQP